MPAHTSVLQVLSSPRRREILRLVWDRELAAGAIHARMSDVTFGAVSLQLRALRQAGLIDARSDRQNRYYRARREALGDVARFLEEMWNDALWRLKLEAELVATRRGPLPQSRRPKPQRRRPAKSRPIRKPSK